jgi:hypothetical protein
MHKRNTALTQIVVLAALTLTSIQTALEPALAQTQPGANRLSREQQGALHRYAIDVWRSLVAMTLPNTGLPADNISAIGERARRTSPTNIASSIWSTLAARDLKIITPDEAHHSIGRILNTLRGMEYHQPSGMFYNWYDPVTGDKLTVWPDNRRPLSPFLSSVDNGWLATALIMIHNNVPEFRNPAKDILDRMNFGVFYDKGEGQLRGGFWQAQPSEPSDRGTVKDHSGKDHAVFFTKHYYGTLNSETRIASYIGIARGQLPDTHYSKLQRGHYIYRGMKIVPSWGGSMFEALMVTLFVPESEWGPKSWGVNHPLYVRAQIEHGLFEAQYGYWGFSPSNNPAGGYREYGVDAIGMKHDGYYSNNDNTPAESSPPASAYTNGVVTPHAVFLALPFAPDAALQNLANLRRDFKDAYGPYGFYDAINVQTGQVAQYYLALDQGMIMAAIANQLGNNQLQGYFANDDVKRALEPLLRGEVFGSGS